MGLDTTHDCWHGAYSAFMRWREAVAKAAGIPLRLMDGFYDGPSAEALEWAAPRDGGPACRSHHGPMLHGFCTRVDALLPISWESLRPDVIHVLLNHSDCDGEIEAKDCGPLADRLEALLPFIDGRGNYREGADTRSWIDGLRRAAAAGENVEFH